MITACRIHTCEHPTPHGIIWGQALPPRDRTHLTPCFAPSGCGKKECDGQRRGSCVNKRGRRYSERNIQVKGTFITFEGIEGSGKSTQIALLASYLTAKGIRTVLTREPGGTLIGDQVRKILLDPANRSLDPTAELLLYAASRAQHLHEIILPALAGGMTVLCDRFSDATLAYQGYGRGLDIELIRSLDQIVTRAMRPDLTILFDIESATGIARARGRNNNLGLEAEARFENEELIFHDRVRHGYLTLVAQDPARIRVVDASADAEAVQEQVRNIVEESLRSG
jgi:dTMP kinase